MIPSILTKHCYLTWDTPPDPVENTGKGAVNQVLDQDFYLCVLLPQKWTQNIAVKTWKCAHKKSVYDSFPEEQTFIEIYENYEKSEDFCQA